METTFDFRPIGISQDTVAFLRTVLPCSFVHGTISPLADALTCHSSLQPLPFILPPLLLADEHAMSGLVPIDVVTIIEITVVKLADTMSIRYVVHEVTVVEFALGERVLSDAFHLAEKPVAFVSLLEHISAGKVLFRC